LGRQAGESVIASRDGSLVLFFCESEEEREWLEENTNAEGYQWMGRDALAVELRYAGALAGGLVEAGLLTA
jgi:hypothetical protein